MGALASNEPTINEKKKYEISLQNGLLFRIHNSLDGDGRPALTRKSNEYINMLYIVFTATHQYTTHQSVNNHIFAVCLVEVDSDPVKI